MEVYRVMAENGTAVANEKRKRTRSPAYPYINLETALARAKTFFAKEQRNAANVAVAMQHWGYGTDSSNGAQTVAALTSFGLLQDEGTGDKRKVRLTQDALRILLDERPDSQERAALIKKAALAPKIHQEIWKKWGTSLSDASLKHALLFEWQPPFNVNAVDYFIREYRSTIGFAKLLDSDKVGSEVKEDGNSDDSLPYVAQIGDYVQWECDGVLKFPQPLRVTGLTPDGTYAYVEGQNGALPRNELIRESPPEGLQNASNSTLGKQLQPPPKNVLMQEFVVPLSNGSKAVFQWPMSLSKEDVEDLKDSLRMMERKIGRSLDTEKQE